MHRELSSDAKLLIRRYTTSLFVLPGAVGAILFFFAGFFINDVFKKQIELATEKAELEAQNEARTFYQDEFHRLFISTSAQKRQIDTLLYEAKANYEESETLVARIKATDAIYKGFTDQKEIAGIVLEALRKDQRFMEELRTWPSGQYGIWAVGGCPKGFQEKKGFLRALQIFARTAAYVRTESLGDSSIVVHNNGQSGNMVDLNLSVCIRT